MKRHYEKTIILYHQEIERLEQEIERLEKEVNRLEQDNDTLDLRRCDAESELEKAEAKIGELEAKNCFLQNACEEKDRRFRDANAALMIERQIGASKEALIEQLRAENNGKNKMIEAEQSRSRALEDRVPDL